MSKGYSKYELIPNAHLLLSSLRSMGYTEETAIADIVDNCIAAESKNVCIKFDWDKKRIIIYDDGKGMNQEELLNGMRIGSADPSKNRNTSDLGKFGMGMKTAAFSIGKKLTVVSKENNKFSNACWDLDYIQTSEEWKVLILEDSSEVIDEAKSYMENNLSGTMLIIDNLDKLIDEENLEKSKNKFYKIIKKVRIHIGLVFHRFIEEDNLTIKINGNLVFPWNPFILENKATQELLTEEYHDAGNSVIIEPFVLPHKTKFNNEKELELAAGPQGWFKHQGFYVYRNRRLLVYGTWFNKIRKEVAFNLARIKLDVTSNSDSDWNIDIKKSKAIPPVYLDDVIEQVIDIVTRKSAEVYNSRGTYAKNTSSNIINLKHVWEQRKNKSGKYMFYINKKHPLLQQLYRGLDETKTKELKSFITLLENYSPAVLSAMVDTLGGNNENDIDEKIKSNDLVEIREKIQIFESVGFDKEEILDAFSLMTEYTYLYSEIENILKEK